MTAAKRVAAWIKRRKLDRQRAEPFHSYDANPDTELRTDDLEELVRGAAEAPAMEKSLRRMVRYYETVFSPMEEPDWLIDARTILARIGENQ